MKDLQILEELSSIIKKPNVNLPEEQIDEIVLLIWKIILDDKKVIWDKEKSIWNKDIIINLETDRLEWLDKKNSELIEQNIKNSNKKDLEHDIQINNLIKKHNFEIKETLKILEGYKSIFEWIDRENAKDMESYTKLFDIKMKEIKWDMNYHFSHANWAKTIEDLNLISNFSPDNLPVIKENLVYYMAMLSVAWNKFLKDKDSRKIIDEQRNEIEKLWFENESFFNKNKVLKGKIEKLLSMFTKIENEKDSFRSWYLKMKDKIWLIESKVSDELNKKSMIKDLSYKNQISDKNKQIENLEKELLKEKKKNKSLTEENEIYKGVEWWYNQKA